ncbi:sensor histidine kinase [Sphingobacterium faecium]|uniref:sensor histidine kinase n=1 Tax=Sphingobacterium faecium TaxID=34087 RepID=UPI001474A86C|nr:HAMP domain-containing sensor histidine kinase [Sphingobacterium faecium]
MKASELFKTKVLSITFHDLRTPFTSMDMLLHTEDVSQMTQPELQQIFAALGNQVSISKNMLNEVLLWAESQLRDNLENKESFTIVEQIIAILSLFEHNLKEKNLVINNTVPLHRMVHMSRDIFCFVIRNIISNAIKFSHNGGTIRIGILESEQNAFQLFIENKGDNISDSTISNLNNRNSWEYKKTVNHTGTGLGVSLCKDLLQRVGGRLHFENRTADVITVYISLPLECIDRKTNELRASDLVERNIIMQ